MYYSNAMAICPHDYPCTRSGSGWRSISSRPCRPGASGAPDASRTPTPRPL